MDTISVISFNCKGFSISAHDLNDLCSKYEVLLLQEKWLEKNELSYLSLFHPHFLGHGVSPVDPSAGIVKGRKFGGVGVLWRKSLSQYIQNVKTNHTWFTGISIKTTNMTIYILCVYTPCDSMQNEDKFLNCLGILDSYIKSLPSMHIIVTGDFYTDHGGNSSFSVFLDNFIVENRLCLLDKEMLPTGSFTYLSTA